MLSTKMISANFQSLKFPDPSAVKKIEPNSIEAVKQIVADKKKIKLYRKKN